MSIKLGEGEVYVAVRPSIIRRVVSLTAMIVLGGWLVYVGVNIQSGGFVWRAILVLAGIAILALGQKYYRATANGIELTDQALRDTTGRVLCRLDEIEKVERGAFAFKPSNGLSIRVSTDGPNAWEPGLWWRWGRRIGIGGSTAPGAAKALADTITLIQKDGNFFGIQLTPEDDEKPR